MNCPLCGKSPKRTTNLDGKFVCNECYLAARPEELSHACVECGELTKKGQWCPEEQEELEFWSLCFGCNHFLKCLYLDGVTAVWGGSLNHYVIGPEPATPTRDRCLGFGGAKWEIEFLDGHRVVSHNLWTLGTIPYHLHDRFPVNARFGFDEAKGAA